MNTGVTSSASLGKEARRTSEQIYGIEPQPDDTCPMIDGVIEKLRDAAKCMKGFEREEDTEMLRKMLEAVESELFSWSSDAEADLEKIRSHVEAIRAWGQEWKNLATTYVSPNEAA